MQLLNNEPDDKVLALAARAGVPLVKTLERRQQREAEVQFTELLVNLAGSVSRIGNTPRIRIAASRWEIIFQKELGRLKELLRQKPPKGRGRPRKEAIR